VRVAQKDPQWRQDSWKLLLSSVSEDGPEGFESEDGSEDLDPTLSKRRGPPTHSELYWLLVCIIRKSLGPEASKLEPWAPLLTLVVTQLAFGPRMVTAMLERDEQHSRHNRFAELCSAVVNGFSKYGSSQKGTVILLHYRCSSAVFQSKDHKEAAVLKAFQNLCLLRRRDCPPEGEKRPLILCVVSRDLRDGRNDALAANARTCAGLVEAEDLGPEDTNEFVEHLLQHPDFASGQARNSSPRPSSAVRELANARRKSSSAQQQQPFQERAPSVVLPTMGFTVKEAPDEGEMEVENSSHFATSDSMSIHLAPSLPTGPSNMKISNAHVLTEYVFEVTGGNPFGVMTVMQELIRQEVLVTIVSSPGHGTALALTPECQDVAWLRESVKPPSTLVAMAWSVFERSDPKAQMLMKAASTFVGDFGIFDLKVILEESSMEALVEVLKKLSDPRARALRKVADVDVVDSPVGGVRSALSPCAEGDLSRRSSFSADHAVQNRGTLTKGGMSLPKPSPAAHGSFSSPGSRRNSRNIAPLGVASPGGVDRRKSEARRPSKIMSERYQFYSDLLRHVASTLLLDSQRQELRAREAKEDEEDEENLVEDESEKSESSVEQGSDQSSIDGTDMELEVS